MENLTQRLKAIMRNQELRDNETKAEANRRRQADLKARRNAAGFHQVNEWVHDEDRQALKEFARCLRAKRFEGEAE